MLGHRGPLSRRRPSGCPMQPSPSTPLGGTGLARRQISAQEALAGAFGTRWSSARQQEGSAAHRRTFACHMRAIPSGTDRSSAVNISQWRVTLETAIDLRLQPMMLVGKAGFEPAASASRTQPEWTFGGRQGRKYLVIGLARTRTDPRGWRHTRDGRGIGHSADSGRARSPRRTMSLWPQVRAQRFRRRRRWRH